MTQRRVTRLFRFPLKYRQLISKRHRDRTGLWIRQLHKLPGAWVVVDRTNGTIFDGSVHFRQMLGLRREQLMGHPISEFSGDPDTTQWTSKRFNTELTHIQGRHEDVTLTASDGRRIMVDVHVSHPIRFGLGTVAVCLVTDSTERQRLQTELIAKHKELRKAFVDLEQKSADLIRLNGEIGELSAILSRASSLAVIGELTAELTHQLNNPLAAAISTGRRIEKILEQNNIEGHEAVTALLRDSHARLKDIMNELKRVYRSSRGADSTPEPIDLKAQLESAMMLLQQRLATIDVLVDVEESLPCIVGRPSEIQHVLVNLIDNALEAMDTQGKLEIRARSNGRQVLLWVGDSGPGIPIDQREKVFEPFFTTREQGSGLGLSVVRRNIQNNKATIRVGRSALGGAEFEIGFPMEAEQ